MSTLSSVREKPVAVLSAACALLLVGVVVLGVLAAKWHHKADQAVDDASARTDASQAALDAAKKDLVKLSSYSYKNGAADFGDWYDDCTDNVVTPAFRKVQGALKKFVIDSHTVAVGTVIDAAPRLVSTTDVEVLAFVDQRRTANTFKGATVEQQRISMTMKLVGGKWLIDRVQSLNHSTGSGASG